MLKRLSDIFMRNLPLKLLSLLLAVVVWYMVVLNNDPTESRGYDIHVDVTNSSYIENGKQIYHIEDEYKTVTVYVTANRSTLNELSDTNITVTADLTQIVDLDRDPVMVPLQVSCAGLEQSALTLSRSTIPIEIENIASMDFPVTVDTGDTSPDKNYEVGRAVSSLDTITIRGPQSIVEQIDNVLARIDVSDLSRDTEKTAELILIDKNQEELSSQTIEDDLTFNGESDPPSITVQVQLWRKQSDVTLHVETEGSPAYGYQVGEITTLPADLTVVGSDEALAALEANGNQIEVPGSYISVEGRNRDFSETIDITDLLPEDIRVSANTGSEVKITVSILEEDSTEFTMDVDAITEENLPDNLTVSYDQAEYKIRVKSDGGSLASLSQNDISAAIDFNGLTEGDYSRPVKITLPEGYSMPEQVELVVHLKEKAGS